jgi:uncharacterized protein (TIGR03435 family)
VVFSKSVTHCKLRPWGSRRLTGLGILAVTVMAGVFAALAQTTAPQFDVASIKLANPSTPGHGRLTRMEALLVTSPGMLSAHGVTLKELIEGAYSLDHYQVTGGPEWLESLRFELEGKATGGAGRQQLLLMLRPLLAERFKLTFHRDTKELPVYALVLSKGAKLKTYQSAEGAPIGRNRLGRNTTIADFAKYLTRLGGELPVIDKTGLTGNFDLDLDMQRIIDAAGADSGNATNAGIFQATVDGLEEQTGLRMVRTKAPVEMLLVDHAERPSQN